MSNRLADKRVLVIGGSSGIGEATALQAAQAGAQRDDRLALAGTAGRLRWRDCREA